MTIWAFGGSYSEIKSHDHDTWMQQISNNLGTELKSFGISGSSLDYTYKTFNEIRDQIDNNDIIIMTIQDLDRRWFFKDDPDKTNYYYWASRLDQNKALKYYLLYLNNSEIHNLYFLNFFHNLHNFIKKKNIHTVILPGFVDSNTLLNDKKIEFDNFNIAYGTLNQLSQDELNPMFIKKYDYTYDMRTHHMIKTNHTILANKIIDNIKNKTPIDLQTGFIKDIVNQYSLKDIEFSKKELFNIHLNDDVWNYYKFK